MKAIIVKPVITEKATLDQEKHGRFTFIVNKTANKIEVKKAVEEMYGVAVESVNTVSYGVRKPKLKYTNRGVSYQTEKAYKKAIVILAKGDTIDLYGSI